MSWDVDGAERRMDIIGQNGNEGLHYDKEEFNDYGQRIIKDKNNTQDKHKSGKKKYNNKYYKKPNTPVTPKQMK
jgi:hypothetical protein